MRSLLTMLGIIIGIAAVMIIVSVITGANKKAWNTTNLWAPTKSAFQRSFTAVGTLFEEVYNYCKKH